MELPDLTDGKDFDGIYEDIARQLVEGKELNMDALYSKTAAELIKALNNGLGTAYSDETTNDGFKKALVHNIEQFSYAKTLTQFQFFKNALYDDKGEIRSLAAVKAAIHETGEIFNARYLAAEHQFVVQSAIMAQKWDTLDSEYLEFNTVGDSRVRASHKLFDKFTALKTDPIWKRLYTPLDWGCRCTVIPGIAKNVSKEYDSEWANKMVDPLVKGTIFDNNAALTGKIFTDKHPYFKVENSKENSNANYKETAKKLVARLVSENIKVERSELSTAISFTAKGIKEAVNQPHEYIAAKNKMLLNIDEVLKKAEYLGNKSDFKQNPMVEKIHIFETSVKGVRTFLINRELKTGEINFYSVSDGEKIIKGIKK